MDLTIIVKCARMEGEVRFSGDLSQNWWNLRPKCDEIKSEKPQFENLVRPN